MEGEKRKPSEAIGHNSTSSAHMPVRFSFHPYKPCSLARFSEPVNPIHGCIPYKGLGGRQAAWAGKQYCSHRLLPSSQHISPSPEMFVEVPSRALPRILFVFFGMSRYIQYSGYYTIFSTIFTLGHTRVTLRHRPKMKP